MKDSKAISMAVILLVAFFLGGVYVAGHRKGGETSIPRSSTPSSQASPKATTQMKKLDHVFVILEENKSVGDIIGNKTAPFINGLIKKYSLAENYYGVAHPSLPNYLALTSGSTHGVTTDCNPPSAGCELNVPNIADEIETSGRSWKEYAESMPSPCYEYNYGNYVTKHNPFVYYSNIIQNPARCKAHVVPFSRIENDLKSTQTMPDFAFITPNLCSDMHDCSISNGDAWLARYGSEILNSKAFTTQNSLLVITWDEDDGGANRIAAILAGPAVKNGFKSENVYSHYSLLHTIESKWKLQPLTPNDKKSPVMDEFFR
jgi:phospholipase C